MPPLLFFEIALFFLLKTCSFLYVTRFSPNPFALEGVLIKNLPNRDQMCARRMVSAFVTTVSEESAIAAEAIAGERVKPKGASAPAAIGMPSAL